MSRAIFISRGAANRFAARYEEKHDAEFHMIYPVKRRGELLGYCLSMRFISGVRPITEQDMENML